jgi:excisionase family DNA binding protein
MQHTDVPKLLTVNDVAKLLKLSVRSVWRLVASNSIVRPIKIGGSIRWRAEDISVWLAKLPPQSEGDDPKNLKNQMIDRTDHATIQVSAHQPKPFSEGWVEQ